MIDPEIYAIIRSNIRVADQRIGDIKAQAAALHGRRRSGSPRCSTATATTRWSTAIAELRRRAAEQMRANIAAIPDGIYRSKAFVDSDGVVNEPLTIALAVDEGRATTLTFDFTGSIAALRRAR